MSSSLVPVSYYNAGTNARLHAVHDEYKKKSKSVEQAN